MHIPAWLPALSPGLKKPEKNRQLIKKVLYIRTF